MAEFHHKSGPKSRLFPTMETHSSMTQHRASLGSENLIKDICSPDRVGRTQNNSDITRRGNIRAAASDQAEDKSTYLMSLHSIPRSHHFVQPPDLTPKISSSNYSSVRSYAIRATHRIPKSRAPPTLAGSEQACTSEILSYSSSLHIDRQKQRNSTREMIDTRIPRYKSVTQESLEINNPKRSKEIE